MSEAQQSEGNLQETSTSEVCPSAETMVEYVYGELNDESANQVWKHILRCGSCTQELVLLRPGYPLNGPDPYSGEELDEKVCESSEFEDTVLTEYIHRMLDTKGNRDIQVHLQNCQDCCENVVIIKRKGCYPGEMLWAYAARNVGIGHDISEQTYHQMAHHLLHCSVCRADVLSDQKDMEIPCPSDEDVRRYAQACLKNDIQAQLESGIGTHVEYCDACRKRMAKLNQELCDQQNAASN